MKKLILMLFAAIFLSGCATTYTNRNPVGEMFPKISGESLEQKDIQMPDYFKGN